MKKKQLRSKTKRVSHNTKLAITLTLLTLAITLTAYAYRKLAPQPIEIAEIRDASGSVSLALEAQDANLDLNQETTINLKYNSPTQKFTAIQAEISYDPTLITPLSVTPSSSFPNRFVAPKFENSKITFTYGVASEANSGLIGTGNIVAIKIKTLKAGTASLMITSNTITTTEESTVNTLKEVTHASLTIAPPVVITSPSPSPSASPLTSPLSSPSVSPHASPTLSPSPSPSPSITPSPSPTASPIVTKPTSPTNLKYNCYDNGSMITLRWDKVTDVTDYEIVLDQKDGTHDTTVTVSTLEKDISLSSNSSYTWTLKSVKNGVKSDASTITDIKCSSSNNTSTPTPTPSPTATATPKATPKPNLITKAIQNITKPKASIAPSPVPTSANPPSSLVATPAPGSLADVFKSPEPTPIARVDVATPNLLTKILLGWQALFLRIVESFVN